MTTDLRPQAVVCPQCRAPIPHRDAEVRCASCNACYTRDRFGFLNFSRDSSVDNTTGEYAENQEACGLRVFAEYIAPLIRAANAKTVVDVGCGVGEGIAALLEEGIDAYGIDLPGLTKFWAELGRDRNRFFGGDAVRLPFADAHFDFVVSTGVIEHIGTVIGEATLRPDYQTLRERYTSELVRVTKPGGRILLACPNKSFPIDIQHGPSDAAGPRRPLREAIFRRTRMNIHPTWGRNHLVSYREVRKLFPGVQSIEPLPLKRYFGFSAFNGRFLSVFRAVAQAYVDHLPPALRGTAFNPYVLVTIRR